MTIDATRRTAANGAQLALIGITICAVLIAGTCLFLLVWAQPAAPKLPAPVLKRASPAPTSKATPVAAAEGEKLTTADTQAAFDEMFPHGAYERTDNGDVMVYRPHALIPVSGDVYALISSGEIKDGCHACAGEVLVSYVHHLPGGFQSLSPPVGQVVGTGAWGNAPDWKIVQDGGFNAIKTDYGDTSQGCSVESTQTFDLKPTTVEENKKLFHTTGEVCDNK